MTIAGIALTAGSTVANSIAQSKVAKARDQALAAERIRQGGLDQEASALNAQSQDRFEGFGDQQQARATELGDYFAAQKIEQGGEDADAAMEQNVAPTSSNLTIREEQKQRGAATDFADRQGAALGQLRSFGDLLGEKSMQNARDFGQIGQIGGFKRGSSSIVPLELEQANKAGDGAKLFGDILGLGGGLLASGGLGGGAGAGKFPSAPKAFAAAGRTGSPGANLYGLYSKFNQPGLY